MNSFRLDDRFMIPVTPTDLEQPTERLAMALLDWVVVKDTPEGRRVGRIVECEMYQGPHDRAAHSYGGRRTERTAVMFGPPGYAYVYLIYGMYHCLNVVSGPPGAPEAVLIRALEPLGEWPEAQSPRQKDRLLAGPGKLCRALGIDRRFYGHPLWQPPLWLARPDTPWPSYQIARGPRIHVDYAGEAADWPWRFWIWGHPAVSVKSVPAFLTGPQTESTPRR